MSPRMRCRKPPAIPDGVLNRFLPGFDRRETLGEDGLPDGLRKTFPEISADLRHAPETQREPRHQGDECSCDIKRHWQTVAGRSACRIE